jgi:hypothetical protein
MDSTTRLANAVTPLPAFVSHKTVYALKIREANPLVRAPDGAIVGYMLHFDGGFPPIHVDAAWGHKAGDHPIEGGYWVQYGDGYTSWSPADAFEAGYTPKATFGPPRGQEPKYTVGIAGRIINRSTGKAIPDDEPVFVLRAQDRNAVTALKAYALVCSSEDHRAVVQSRVMDFEAFALRNPGRVKEPDSSIDELATANLGPRDTEPPPVNLESDAPLCRAGGEPQGNGEVCESCT